MTVDVQVEQPGSLARVTIGGPVALEGFIQGLETLLGHPDFTPGTDVLVDLLDHVHRTTSADVRALAGALLGASDRLKGSRMAVIVCRTVSYGMARMLQTFVEDAPFRLEVFYDCREAEQWLGIA